MDSKKCFINFLRENKIFSRFYALFKLSVKWRKKFKHPIYEMKYFQEIDPEDFIAYAFLWRNTMEGHSFWLDLSEAWLAKLRALKYNENHYDF